MNKSILFLLPYSRDPGNGYVTFWVPTANDLLLLIQLVSNPFSKHQNQCMLYVILKSIVSTFSVSCLCSCVEWRLLFLLHGFVKKKKKACKYVFVSVKYTVVH